MALHFVLLRVQRVATTARRTQSMLNQTGRRNVNGEPFPIVLLFSCSSWSCSSCSSCTFSFILARACMRWCIVVWCRVKESPSSIVSSNGRPLCTKDSVEALAPRSQGCRCEVLAPTSQGCTSMCIRYYGIHKTCIETDCGFKRLNMTIALPFTPRRVRSVSTIHVGGLPDEPSRYLAHHRGDNSGMLETKTVLVCNSTSLPCPTKGGFAPSGWGQCTIVLELVSQKCSNFLCLHTSTIASIEGVSPCSACCCQILHKTLQRPAH